LPAFFFPPLAAFFAIALIPPFNVEFRVAPGSTARRTAAAWHVGLPLAAPVALSQKLPWSRKVNT
jgi:hypothetical protein